MITSIIILSLVCASLGCLYYRHKHAQTHKQKEKYKELYLTHRPSDIKVLVYIYMRHISGTNTDLIDIRDTTPPEKNGRVIGILCVYKGKCTTTSQSDTIIKSKLNFDDLFIVWSDPFYGKHIRNNDTIRDAHLETNISDRIKLCYMKCTPCNMDLPIYDSDNIHTNTINLVIGQGLNPELYLVNKAQCYLVKKGRCI